MPDVCDQSDSVIALHTAAALSHIRVPIPRTAVTDPCLECGEPVGYGRGLLGYDTCIDCATRIENERRMFALRGHEAY